MPTIPIPRLPNPLTPETIEGLMKARPYWDPSQPESKIYHYIVRRGFEIMYPGPTRFDAIGKRIDPKPLKPQYITHLVDAANREIEKIEREFLEQEGAGGTVHVRAHTRIVDGRVVEVSAYEREAPEGSGDEPISPPESLVPRKSPEFQNMPYDFNRDRAEPVPLGPARKEDLRFKSQLANAADTSSGAASEEEPGDKTGDAGDTQAGTHDGKAGDSLPAPDTREPVDPADFYRKLDFDPNGEKQWEAALRRPLDALRAGKLESEASDITRNEYPGVHPHNNEADAFRHAYWSLEAARQLGPEAAKEFGDAHERSDSNPTPERLMDLFNNKVGRDLALDPENADRDSRDVIREAIREGKLRTSPFETNEPPSPFPDRAPGLLYRPPGGQRR